MAQKTIVIATGVGAIPEILNFAGDRPLGLEIILRSSQSISRQVDFILNESEEFYNDMMAERRAIRQARIDAAIKRSERRRFWIDTSAVVIALIVVTSVVLGMISLIGGAS